MSFAQPWWLAALALLLPLVILHLRRPALAVREVAEPGDLGAARAAVRSRPTGACAGPGIRGTACAAQAFALCVLVLALAGPSAPERRAAADDRLRRGWLALDARRHPPGGRAHSASGSWWPAEPTSRVVVVSATGTPSIAYQGPAKGLAGALGKLSAGSGERAISRRGSRSAPACSRAAAGASSCCARPRTRCPEIASAPGEADSSTSSGRPRPIRACSRAARVAASGRRAPARSSPRCATRTPCGASTATPPSWTASVHSRSELAVPARGTATIDADRAAWGARAAAADPPVTNSRSTTAPGSRSRVRPTRRLR